MKLVVDFSLASKTVTLVQGVCGWRGEVDTVYGKTGSHPQLLTNGSSVTQPKTILRYVVKNSTSTHLLGSSTVQQALVEEWLSAFATTMVTLSRASVDFLSVMNSRLSSTACLAGNTVTLADLAMFPALWGHMAVLDKQERRGLSNLVRWFNFMQHYPSIKAAAPAANLPLLDLTPPQSKLFKTDYTKQIQAPGAAAGAGGAGAGAGAGGGAGAGSDKAKKAADKKAAKEAKKKAKAVKLAAAAKLKGSDAYRLEVRVGVVKSAEMHPTEARLYVEQIDMGEATPRTVVSGIAEYVKMDEFVGKKVCVIANLKLGVVKGVESNGRVLVATSKDGKTKECVEPPADAAVGEKITFSDVGDKPSDKEVSSKNFSKILKKLSLNDQGVAIFGDMPFTTSKGPCTVPTIKGGKVA